MLTMLTSRSWTNVADRTIASTRYGERTAGGRAAGSSTPGGCGTVRVSLTVHHLGYKAPYGLTLPSGALQRQGPAVSADPWRPPSSGSGGEHRVQVLVERRGGDRRAA